MKIASTYPGRALLVSYRGESRSVVTTSEVVFYLTSLYQPVRRVDCILAVGNTRPIGCRTPGDDQR
ncbi:hypothetical protein IG631_05270 [Alternaria alternata]|nr:hypothetical protein IG631_05270 [Alternaria alternata]